MNLKLDMDIQPNREELRRAVLNPVAERKMPSKNGVVEILSFSFRQVFVVRFTYALMLSAPPWTKASALRRFLDHFTALETGCFRRLCGHETATRQHFYRVAAV